jgi:hypothetical protein
MVIKSFDTEHVGKYTCKADNSLGSVSKEVTVGIKLAPIVTISPQQLEVKEGEKVSVGCSVKDFEGNYTIRWKIGSKNMISSVSLQALTSLLSSIPATFTFVFRQRTDWIS